MRKKGKKRDGGQRGEARRLADEAERLMAEAIARIPFSEYAERTLRAIADRDRYGTFPKITAGKGGRRGVHVGAALRALRKTAGLSQRAMAAALGVHHRSVEDWEAGRTTVDRMKAVELLRRAEALG